MTSFSARHTVIDTVDRLGTSPCLSSTAPDITDRATTMTLENVNDDGLTGNVLVGHSRNLELKKSTRAQSANRVRSANKPDEL